MEQYDMTYPQFCEDYLTNCRYKEKYLERSDLWEAKKQDLKSTWREILLTRATQQPLRHQVIQSYIRIFGEQSLWSTFRGRFGKGVSEFRIPKKIRSLR